MGQRARPRGDRRRIGVMLAGMVLIAGVGASAAAVIPSGASTGDSSRGSSTTTQPEQVIIVCEAGPETSDRIETASASATRVPAGTPVPPGCRLG